MKPKINVFFLTLFISVLCISPNVFSSNDAQRLYSLIDYIGGDYQFAVNSGKIINEEEYNEMTEFSDSALTIFSRLNSDDSKLKLGLETLDSKIKNKAPVKEIQTLTGEIKNNLLSVFNIATNPLTEPSINSGSALFSKNCTTCHGEKGDGVGVLAANLEPRPTNFKDPDVSLTLSPLKVFNTLNFGIEGTSMPAFSTLSDKEKWDIAFYVLSIGFPDGISASTAKKNIPDGLSNYKVLSSITNQDIKDRLSIDDGPAFASIKQIRNSFSDEENSEDKYVGLTIAGINSALENYKNGDFKKAHDQSIEAYLEGYEQIEADLSIADNSLAVKIETDLAKYRSEIKNRAPVNQVEALNKTISNDLNKASAILSDQNSFNSAVLFTSSFSIIVREALEAILIIAAIIAFLINTGSTRAIRYIHFGWVSAIIAGLLTWYLARTVISISGASRELIEGFTSIIAAAVLFYVSYWLISKIEVEKWKEFIKTKVETALNKKSVIALVSVAFLAVYREAFETVLFYQALGYQAEGNISPIIWGLLAGAVFIAIVGFLIFKLAIRIPIKYFFSVTSLLLYILCFILIGKGVHELQGAGIVGTTFVNYIPRVDILGIYPTLETAVPQLVIVAAFIFASFWIANVSREKERKEIAVNVSRISHELKTMYDSFDHIKGHILEWRRCEEIDLEAEELDRQIHDVIDHVNQLQNKLGDFYQNVSKPENTEPENLN
ncbi:MAG: FTR1 family protein [Thermodesulfobacteriota bacterium]